jgi:lipopolysaccharide transport system permease protein
MHNDGPELILESGRAEKNYWKDIWRYRELFYILSWRDIKVRYKQTVLGALWGILRPVLTMIAFVFAFGRLGGMAKDTAIPYPLLVFSALLPWQFFSTALTEASVSLIGNTNLISNILRDPPVNDAFLSLPTSGTNSSSPFYYFADFRYVVRYRTLHNSLER